MIIVIDAYNVLKQIKQDIINKFERKSFVNKLRKYAKSKSHSIVVVFDGGECVWPMVEKDRHVTTVYSGERLSADDYIRRYMKEHKNKELMLVTDDNELKKNARHYEIDTFGSRAFYKRIHPMQEDESTKKPPQLIKTSADAPLEIDALMEAIGTVPIKNEDKEEYLHTSLRTPSGFTASKKERKIRKKIKKL